MFELREVTHTVTEEATFAVCDRCGKISDEKVRRDGCCTDTVPTGFSRIIVGAFENKFKAIVCNDCFNEIKVAIEATGCKLSDGS